ncbi:MAG: MaoC/PaaZ C-terminal domain-containing protein [Afipia sp.]|nr:MaoC/PaaZ C-terminal domain-containing protein [Afipia sp.]
MEDIYFEDIVLGSEQRVGPYEIKEEEMIEFGRNWDPLPIHIDKDFAASHGGLTAPGIFLLAIKMKLLHSLPVQKSVIASAGFDELRFHRPAKAGDMISLLIRWQEKRPSLSKPDRGIVVGRYFLLNGKDDVVLSHLDTVMMRLRPPLARNS